MKNLFFIVCAFLCTYTNAQLSIDNVNTNYIIDFETTLDGINSGQYNASGFSSSPSSGQLDSDGIIILGCSEGDMTFCEENTENDLTRGTSKGGIGIGGIYAFEVEDDNYALGFQPTGDDFTSGDIILKLSNNTGNAISNLSLQYDIWCFNDQDRGNSMYFLYSTDNISYTSVSDLDFVSDDVGNDPASWVKQTKSATLDIQMADNGNAYLKWTSDDVNGSGSRDEIAIDNIIIKAQAGSNTSVEENNLEDVFMSPNPCTDQFTVQTKDRIKKVDVYDISGNLILSKGYSGENKIVISTSNLKNGIYIVKVMQSNGLTLYRRVYKNM